MALNFELVASDQLFSVVLASCKWFKISAHGVEMRHMWQLDTVYNLFIFHSKTVTVGWSLSRSFWGAVATSQWMDAIILMMFILPLKMCPPHSLRLLRPSPALPSPALPSPALHCTALPWLAECSVQIIWLVTYEVGGTLKLEIWWLYAYVTSPTRVSLQKSGDILSDNLVIMHAFTSYWGE